MGIYDIDANRIFDRWAKAVEEIEEKDKEIERLKKENGTLSDECITYTKEIERLRKEKEWLFSNYVKTLTKVQKGYTKEEYTALLIENMQQALKES